MDDETKSSDYRVEFGKPPATTRFKKGQSGNPKGRPKGRLNFATVLERTLRKTVVISENGRRKTITKLEAAIKQLVNRGASGDQAALKQLIVLVQSAEQRAQSERAQSGGMADADQKVMQGVLKKLEASWKQGGRDVVE